MYLSVDPLKMTPYDYGKRIVHGLSYSSGGILLLLNDLPMLFVAAAIEAAQERLTHHVELKFEWSDDFVILKF